MNTGTQVTGVAGNSTVNVGTSSQDLERILDSTLSGTVSAVSNQGTALQSSLSGLLDQQSKQIAELSKSVQSGGDTLWEKPFFGIALAVLAVVVLFIWKGK